MPVLINFMGTVLLITVSYCVCLCIICSLIVINRTSLPSYDSFTQWNDRCVICRSLYLRLMQPSPNQPGLQKHCFLGNLVALMSMHEPWLLQSLASTHSSMK